MVSFRGVLFAQASLLQSALACGFHAGLSPTENPLLRRSAVPELPTKKILIQNVRVFDVHVILPPRDIVIDESIIRNDSTDPDEIIDGHHGFLIPGLIDSHTHVQQISHMEDLSRYGVTTAFNMNCMNFTNCEIFKSQVGLTSIFTAGVPIIAPNSDHARTTPIPKSMLVTDVSQAELYVGLAVANGSDFMKIVSEENGPTQEMQDAAVQASHSRGIQSSTRASWRIPYQQAIQSKTDSIHHIFGESLLAKRWLLRMKAQGQFSVPTLTVMRYVSENPIAREFLHGTVETNQSYPIYRENVKRLHEARVPVVAGTDAVGYVEGLFDMPHGLKLHEELENLVEAGMMEIEALRAATSLPAELRSLSDRGVIAPGRRPDLILLNSDPFVTISNTKDINKVWIQEDSFYYPGTVEIEGDRIAKIYHGNPSAEVLSDPSITAIDGTDKLVMPGFVDLHFHTSVAKGFGDELPLKEYLEEVWYPSVRALTPERAYIGALHSYCTAIKSGTTTVNDMYRFVGSLAEAAAKIGIRAVLSNEVALPEHKLDLLEDNEQSYLQHNGKESDRIRVWLGHEWMCTSNLELMAKVGKMKSELGTGLHIHLCESQQEVEDTRAKYGRTPVEIAYESGCLGPDTVAAHCVHLTDRDIGLLAETGTSVSYDPGSNAKLGNGIVRLQALQEKGVNVGMGVDAFECENSPDMFELMKFGSLIQRALHQDASLAKPYNILRMATGNGAKALGIDAGVIAPGKKADLIVVDLTKNQMFTPLLKDPPKRKMMLESHLVFGCNGSAVQHSIIDSVLVMKDFKMLALDEEKLRQDMDAMFEEISGDMKLLIVK